MAAEVTVLHGDMLDHLPELAARGATFDACVTDPPYHLSSIVKRFSNDNAAPAKSDGPTGVYARASSGFMGQKWDGGDIAFRPETWRLVYELLKPGAHLLAFSGTRTYHRMVCAIEDAGFEVRDQIGWLFGSGFPKSHNLEGDWGGWGTALKPAWEPIVLARKPLDGTVAANVLEHGTGALNIDGCRVPTTGETISAGHADSIRRGNFHEHEGWQRPWKTDVEEHARRREAALERANTLGRWPANVVHDGSDEVLAAFAQFGERQTSKPGAVFKRQSATELDGYRGAALGAESRSVGTPMIAHGDTGTAARFFYSAKADATDRLGSKHPTVKPVDLMRWLVRLVTPPGGTVLDPFAGTGTTGMACLAEGFDCTLIEMQAKYVEDIRRRLKHVRGEDTPLFGDAHGTT